MQDKIRKILFLTVLLVLCYGTTVFGYTGKGTSGNPYIVSSEKDFREVILENNKTSWVYIAVKDTIGITKTLSIGEGKFRIYAIHGGQTIQRSKKLNVSVNEQPGSRYCMKVTGSAEVVLGYGDNHDTLTVSGSSGVMKNNHWSSTGWLYINGSASVTIGKSCRVTNIINNVITSENAPIYCKGKLVINGEISNTEGNNGGAIKVREGNVEIGSSGKIHHCSSKSEGGAIHASVGAKVTLNGGKIYNCSSAQEGGAIFIRETVTCRLNSGDIFNNSSGESAGAIFAGYGGTLYVGQTSGTGPKIYNNTAKGSGGGIRCNGGSGERAGGTTYLYGGQVSNNYSGKYGGGIACGEPGSANTAKMIMKNIIVAGNSSEKDGGGIRIPQGTKGIGSDGVQIENCRFTGNVSKGNGGGLSLLGKVNGLNIEVSSNQSNENGGGIYIGPKGELTYKNNSISKNKCTKFGSGVFVYGKFKMASGAVAGSENIVYLKSGTYIEIIEKLNKSSGYLANIESEQKNNGTKVIKISYRGGNAESDLYYSGNAENELEDKPVSKKYAITGYEKSRLLRPGNNVNGYDSQWIIISEKYHISYDKNTMDQVSDMPLPQVKFWNENIRLSKNIIKRENTELNNEKHWNFSSNGSGKRIAPGEEYTDNGNRILYAQWDRKRITKLIIHTVDRYYAVGQKITLNNQELLKKVTVNDNENSGTKYDVHVTQIESADNMLHEKGDDIKTENFVTTKRAMHYVFTLKSADKTGTVITEAKMNVFIIESPLQNGQVRYITLDYIHTLSQKSKWSRDSDLKEKLLRSLRKEKGSGIYTIKLTCNQIRSIRESIRDNGYNITRQFNQKTCQLWKKEE